MKIISLFSGAGGLDLGFLKAGFQIIWANEHDPEIWDTIMHNFPEVQLDKRSITEITPEEIPDCDGIVIWPDENDKCIIRVIDEQKLPFPPK